MTKMKHSMIDWIGDIPENWKLRRLRFLCSIQTGNLDTQNNNPDGEYPFYVRSPIVEHSDEYTFDNEAVLMAGDGVGAGKVFHYVNGKYGCHQRVYSLSDFREIEGKYLYYYLLENFHKKIEASNAKSTVDSVRLPMIKDFSVTVPPLSKQRMIIDYLDTACSTINDIIEKKQLIIEKLAQYKSAIITETVTRGLHPNAEMKESGIQWLGLVPSSWKQTRLSELCDRSITYGIVKMGDEDKNGVKVLRCSDIQPGYIDDKNIRTVTHDLSDEYSRTILHGGEIVINVRGTLGGCAIVPKTMVGYNIAREVAMVSVVSANPEYVMFNFLSDAFLSYQKYSLRGGVYVGLNINLLSKYIIFLPPYDEQIQIAKFLKGKCLQIDDQIERRKKEVTLLTDYRKSLIYEIVTGKKEVPQNESTL